MANPTQLFLVCHAPLGSALHAVACHGFGQKLSDVVVLDVLSSQTPQQVAEGLTQLWQDHGQPTEVLVITDLLGATPANGAQLWLKALKTQTNVDGLGLAGVSLPGLLRALTYRELPARALVDKLLQDPDQGCCSLMQDEDAAA